MTDSPVSERVEITPELLADLEALASGLPHGWWHACVGSGHNVCTTLVSEADDGSVTLLADFLPDWFLEAENAGRTLPDHVAMLKYAEALHPRCVLALVERIRELEREREAAEKLLAVARAGLRGAMQDLTPSDPVAHARVLSAWERSRADDHDKGRAQ